MINNFINKIYLFTALFALISINIYPAATISPVVSGKIQDREALIMAIESDKHTEETIKKLNEYTYSDGETALILSAALGNANLAKLLITRGDDVNSSDKFGRTALIRIVAPGGEVLANHKSVVKLLIENNINLDAASKLGMTALIQACHSFNNMSTYAEGYSSYVGRLKEIIQLLLQAGSDINKSNKWGEKAIDYAGRIPMNDPCWNDKIEIKKLLENETLRRESIVAVWNNKIASINYIINILKLPSSLAKIIAQYDLIPVEKFNLFPITRYQDIPLEYRLM